MKARVCLAFLAGSKTICKVVPGKIFGSQPYIEFYVRVDLPFKEIAFIVVKGRIHRQHEFSVHVQDHAGYVVLSFAARDRSGLQNDAGPIFELLLADSDDLEFIMFQRRMDILMQSVEYMTKTNLGADLLSISCRPSGVFETSKGSFPQARVPNRLFPVFEKRQYSPRYRRSSTPVESTKSIWHGFSVSPLLLLFLIFSVWVWRLSPEPPGQRSCSYGLPAKRLPHPHRPRFLQPL